MTKALSRAPMSTLRQISMTYQPWSRLLQRIIVSSWASSGTPYTSLTPSKSSTPTCPRAIVTCEIWLWTRSSSTTSFRTTKDRLRKSWRRYPDLERTSLPHERWAKAIEICSARHNQIRMAAMAIKHKENEYQHAVPVRTAFGRYSYSRRPGKMSHLQGIDSQTIYPF